MDNGIEFENIMATLLWYFDWNAIKSVQKIL